MLKFLILIFCILKIEKSIKLKNLWNNKKSYIVLIVDVNELYNKNTTTKVSRNFNMSLISETYHNYKKIKKQIKKNIIMVENSNNLTLKTAKFDLLNYFNFILNVITKEKWQKSCVENKYHKLFKNDVFVDLQMFYTEYHQEESL